MTGCFLSFVIDHEILDWLILLSVSYQLGALLSCRAGALAVYVRDHLLVQRIAHGAVHTVSHLQTENFMLKSYIILFEETLLRIKFQEI